MGLQNSKNEYSFGDHYYIIEDSFPADNYYRLQSKLTDQLFVGREIHSLDEDDQYQMQCVVDQKLKNSSPFVTKLISAEKNIEHGYCQTNSKFYLLYREVSKLLSHEIQERRQRKQPFTAEQITSVIIRVAKGLKYLYQIGHFHGNVSENAISWPVFPSESVQLIDEWSLRVQHRSMSKIDKNYPDFGQGRSTQHSNDLYSLGIVAKKMLEISPQLQRDNSPLMQSIKHKLFVLLSQNQYDRVQIYNLFNNHDREIQNRLMVQENSQFINHNKNHHGPSNNQQAKVANQQKVPQSMFPVNQINQTFSQQQQKLNHQPYPAFQMGAQSNIGATNLTKTFQSNLISTQNNTMNLGKAALQPISANTTVKNTEKYGYFPDSQRFNQYAVNNSTAPALTAMPNINTPNLVSNNNVKVKFGNSSGSNMYSNLSNTQPNSNFSTNKISSSSSAISGFSNFSTNYPMPKPMIPQVKPNIETGIKQKFDEVASNQPNSYKANDYKIPNSDFQRKFDQFARSNTSQTKNTGSLGPSPFSSSIPSYKFDNGDKNSLPRQSGNQFEVITSMPNNNNIQNSFSPTFGSPGISSTGQHSSSLFSFQDSLSSGGSGGQASLFTSPDFFSKIHGTEMRINNIKIEDHGSRPQQSATLPNPPSSYSQQITKAILSSTPVIHPEYNKPPTTISDQEALPAVTTSLTSQTQNPTVAAKQISISGNFPSYSAPQNNYSSSFNNNLHVTVIPELNQVSEAEDLERDYVVEEYENGSRYEGEKAAGMRDGQGKFYYKEGSYYDGNWKNNNMHGFGRLYYPNHKLAYEGEWFIDQFHGHGKVYNDEPANIEGTFDYTNFDNIEEKWKYYEGTLVCDSKEGFGKLVLSNGEYYEGNFQGDRVHGEGKFVNLYNESIKGVWNDGKLIKINQL